MLGTLPVPQARMKSVFEFLIVKRQLTLYMDGNVFLSPCPDPLNLHLHDSHHVI